MKPGLPSSCPRRGQSCTLATETVSSPASPKTGDASRTDGCEVTVVAHGRLRRRSEGQETPTGVASGCCGRQRDGSPRRVSLREGTGSRRAPFPPSETRVAFVDHASESRSSVVLEASRCPTPCYRSNGHAGTRVRKTVEAGKAHATGAGFLGRGALFGGECRRQRPQLGTPPPKTTPGSSGVMGAELRGG